MHYTGTGDLGTIYANVRYTEAIICEVFLLELSLDGTGTRVSVRYKRLSGLSEDVIHEVYCICYM